MKMRESLWLGPADDPCSSFRLLLLGRALTRGELTFGMYYVAEASAVTDFLKSRRAGDFSCTRCGTAMHEVVSIEPIAHAPGLRAYQCRKCQYVTSVLWQLPYPIGTPAGQFWHQK
jgi:hypothetical protein